MFYTAKNVKLMLNGATIPVSEVTLDQEVSLDNPIKTNEMISQRNIPSSPHIGRLQFKYFLTGQDFIKQYLYSNDIYSLTGNLGGITFNQGYISNYELSCDTFSPAQVNCSINFYDKLSGSFSPISWTHKNHNILKFYNASIDNLSTYTSNTLNNISQINFSYNCQIVPSYKSDRTGTLPSRADRISIGERTLSAEIISDNVNMDIPLSGDKFGLNIHLSNGISSEDFGVSGVINSKQLKFSIDDVHSHSISISQKHFNVIGNISGVITGNGIFTVYSTNGSHPFISNDGTINYVNKVFVDEILCPNYSVSRQTFSDKIVVTMPSDIVNGNVRIECSNGNFVSNAPTAFGYSPILLTGTSPNSGRYGDLINISGSNFYNISNLYFDNIPARFKVTSPLLIQSYIPNGATTEKIKIVSNRRNLTGLSSGYFYIEPIINSISTTTGVWNDQVFIAGNNFSGTTGVKFGNISGNYTVISNNLISTNSPATGAGYAYGNISVFTSGGTAISNSKYQPHVPTYGFSPTSGEWLSPVNIYLKVDTGYLSPTGVGGYKVKFGGIDTIFYPSGYPSLHNNRTGCLTGSIPLLSVDNYIYIYKPSGIETYSPNINKFNVIPDPRIDSMSPNIVNQYKFFSPIIYGQGFKYFSNLPYYFYLSGQSPNNINNIQFFSTVQPNGPGTAMQIPNIMITGGTGYYTAYVQNLAGSGLLTGALLVNSGINKSSSCLISLVSSISLYNSTFYNPQFIIDGNTTTYGGVETANLFNAGITGFGSITLTPKNNALIDVSVIKFTMKNLGGVDVYTNPPFVMYPVKTGIIELYYNNNAGAYTGVPLSLSGHIFFPPSLTPFTGIRNVKIKTDANWHPEILRTYLGLNEIEIY